GTFELRDLPAREFSVTLRAQDFEDSSVTLTGSPGARLEWNPVLGTGLSIRGRLVLEGTDFSSWIVHCESQDRSVGQREPSFSAQVRPDADGSFEIRGCADVAHELEVHRAGSRFWTFPTARREGVHPGSASVVITIDPGSLPSCRLRGRIVDDRGEPVPGIEYMLGREGGQGAPLLAAEADGSFDVGPLAPGKYMIGVHAAGFAPFSAPFVEVTAGATHDFGDLRLSRGGTIAVHLTRAAGFENAELELYAQLPRSRSSASLPVLGDAAHSQVLAPGEYIVELIADPTLGIAQRTRRANVRVGEELALEFPVEIGARVHVAIAPTGNEQAWVEAFDSAGTLLWEGMGWQVANIVLPLRTVRLVARDETGRTAETIASLASLQGQVVTLALK
ncbi:MAG TPA: carboxypeptidase-like regulatory domain-containing protein, partial [Planctomycetota bacterium]|nr:carboxypeptidase-like regulatory domain-containing protein [Planctomycetota bacterium]